ncbi:hypothetical protein [Nocardia yamanashiensis]|uniref:hypothetical protein n=1 Tax=Nocardia yamanashiensis TaxID=209247 RepID=UPI0008343480|nr:hypothetical protein [Nocardia yamanashiensis]
MSATTPDGLDTRCGGEPMRAAEGLLDARQLLLAIAGRLRGSSPHIEWARELADLHATLVTASVSEARRPNDFDYFTIHHRIDTMIMLIDRWAAFHLPRATTGRRHTHSLGEVISHVAGVYAQTQWTLRHQPGAQHQHHAALRFAHAQEGYAELVEEIRALRVVLPAGRWRTDTTS